MNTLLKTAIFIPYMAAINLASSIGTSANADVITDWKSLDGAQCAAGHNGVKQLERGLTGRHHNYERWIE